MRRFRSFAAALVVVSVGLGWLAAAGASGALQLTIEPVSSGTASSRALEIEDVTGGPDQVAIRTISQYIPTEPDGFVDRFGISSSAGFSSTPQGCGADEITNEHRPTISCDYGAFDLVALSTGAGDDRVSASEVPYADLGWKAILSGSTPVFMNVDLGPGRDIFGEGGGTDVVYGDAGMDVIWGGDSNDLLFGGVGPDRLHGNSGNDVMLAGPGKDRCFGSGKDRVRACERLRYEQQ